MKNTPEEDAEIQRLTDAFTTELRELMVKHGVESIVADDHYSGYAGCGQDIRITADIVSAWDGHELKRPYVEINLGKGFYATP